MANKTEVTIPARKLSIPEKGPNAQYISPGGQVPDIDMTYFKQVPGTDYWYTTSRTQRLGAGGQGEIFTAYRVLEVDGQQVPVSTNDVVKIVTLDKEESSPLKGFTYADELPEGGDNSDLGVIKSREAKFQSEAFTKLLDFPANKEAKQADQYVVLPIGVSIGEQNLQTGERNLYLLMEKAIGQSLDRFNIFQMEPDRLTRLLQDYLEITKRVYFLNSGINPISIRDIKPANFMYDPDKERLKLIDFGLAQSLSTIYDSSDTGTPRYTAPEVLKGIEEITPAADNYCLVSSLADLLSQSSVLKRSNNEHLPRNIIENAIKLPENETELEPTFKDLLENNLRKLNIDPTAPETASKIDAIYNLLAISLTRNPTRRFANPIIPIKLTIDMLTSILDHEKQAAGSMATTLARYAIKPDSSLTEIYDLLRTPECEGYLQQFCQEIGIDYTKHKLTECLAPIKEHFSFTPEQPSFSKEALWRKILKKVNAMLGR